MVKEEGTGGRVKVLCPLFIQLRYKKKYLTREIQSYTVMTVLNGVPGLAENCITPASKEIYETIERIILLCIVDINVYRLPVLQKSTLPAGC